MRVLTLLTLALAAAALLSPLQATADAGSGGEDRRIRRARRSRPSVRPRPSFMACPSPAPSSTVPVYKLLPNLAFLEDPPRVRRARRARDDGDDDDVADAAGADDEMVTAEDTDADAGEEDLGDGGEDGTEEDPGTDGRQDDDSVVELDVVDAEGNALVIEGVRVVPADANDVDPDAVVDVDVGGDADEDDDGGDDGGDPDAQEAGVDLVSEDGDGDSTLSARVESTED